MNYEQYTVEPINVKLEDDMKLCVYNVYTENGPLSFN